GHRTGAGIPRCAGPAVSHLPRATDCRAGVASEDHSLLIVKPKKIASADCILDTTAGTSTLGVTILRASLLQNPGKNQEHNFNLRAKPQAENNNRELISMAHDDKSGNHNAPSLARPK